MRTPTTGSQNTNQMTRSCGGRATAKEEAAATAFDYENTDFGVKLCRLGRSQINKYAREKKDAQPRMN